MARFFLISAATLCILFPSGCKGRKFSSQILSERRTFFIHLPRDYNETNTAYPVLYLLDAYGKPSTFGPSFFETAKQVEEMTSEGIPQLIIVGIKNTNRDRDMIPIQSEVLAGRGGGADRFLSFLVEEMIPLIDWDYRTSDKRILYGRSDSGLFVLYALAKNPDSFSAYISSSPTIGHCPEILQQQFTKLFSQISGLEKWLYIIYGEKDIPLAKDYIPDMAENLKTLAPLSFRFKVETVSWEGHIPKFSLAEGLRFIFKP